MISTWQMRKLWRKGSFAPLWMKAMPNTSQTHLLSASLELTTFLLVPGGGLWSLQRYTSEHAVPSVPTACPLCPFLETK